MNEKRPHRAVIPFQVSISRHWTSRATTPIKNKTAGAAVATSGPAQDAPREVQMCWGCPHLHQNLSLQPEEPSQRAWLPGFLRAQHAHPGRAVAEAVLLYTEGKLRLKSNQNPAASPGILNRRGPRDSDPAWGMRKMPTASTGARARVARC